MTLLADLRSKRRCGFPAQPFPRQASVYQRKRTLHRKHGCCPSRHENARTFRHGPPDIKSHILPLHADSKITVFVCSVDFRSVRPITPATPIGPSLSQMSSIFSERTFPLSSSVFIFSPVPGAAHDIFTANLCHTNGVHRPFCFQHHKIRDVNDIDDGRIPAPRGDMHPLG